MERPCAVCRTGPPLSRASLCHVSLCEVLLRYSAPQNRDDQFVFLPFLSLSLLSSYKLEKLAYSQNSGVAFVCLTRGGKKNQTEDEDKDKKRGVMEMRGMSKWVVREVKSTDERSKLKQSSTPFFCILGWFGVEISNEKEQTNL